MTRHAEQNSTAPPSRQKRNRHPPTREKDRTERTATKEQP